MLKTRVGKFFTFEAAHRLPEHDGHCARRHGHSYKVELVFEGELQTTGPKQGMVIDFGDISKWWKRVVEPNFDHYDLNEHPYFAPGIDNVHTNGLAPTAENIALWLWDQAYTAFLYEQAKLVAVRVWETATGYAEVSEDGH